jgi:hypothetical protein
MALKIVGTGLGRTGTKSLQSALNILGFGPCYHMVEVFAHPESTKLWVEAANGRPDWEAIFAGYHSVVDYPGVQFWRELTAHYPRAKVLHTVRDVLGTFGDHIQDRAYMTQYFRKHTQDVISTIPTERLLVYHVSQGWEPLCKFLQVPVPAERFPAQNSRAEFIRRVRAGLLGAPP